MSTNEIDPHTLERLPRIIEGIKKGLTYAQIGAAIGVVEQTIWRDMKEWREKGGLEAWAVDEILRLRDEVDPNVAYRGVAAIVAKMVKQRADVEVKGGVTVQMWVPPEKKKEGLP